ncbi:MAG: DUF2079 domain-containing protein, partial [Anaerolineae bacterium]
LQTFFDLGNFDQTIWNTAHGRPFQFTNVEGLSSRLGVHVEPILIPISLLYLIYSSPKALILLQVAVLALGALPLFWLARERLGSGWSPLFLAALYLLSPTLQGANMMGFYPLTLTASFLAYAFYFMQKGRYGWFWLFALLIMSCKEDMPLLIAAMGLYILFAQRERRLGLVTVLVAALWFGLANLVVIPAFTPQGRSIYLVRYDYLGETLPQILETLFLRPWTILPQVLTGAKLAYIARLLAQFGFLPLLSPLTLVLALPSLAINLLSNFPLMYSPYSYYATPLVPFLAISAIYGARSLSEWLHQRRRIGRERSLLVISTLALLVGLTYSRLYGFSPLARNFRMPQVTAHARLINHFLDLIPPQASVSAHRVLNRRVSQREQVYIFPRLEQADYIFLDVSADDSMHPNDVRTQVEELVGSGRYGILDARDGYILLQRGLEGRREIPDPFYDFARLVEPEPQYPTAIDFGPYLRLLGFDLDDDPEEQMVQLRLYWQVLATVEGDYRLYPFYFDDQGRIIEDTTLRPMVATVWYPPSRWKVREVVQTEMLPWNVGQRFHVGLGVVEGREWEAVEKRLPVQVVASQFVPRLFDNGTWVELLSAARVGGKVRPVGEKRQFAIPAFQQAVEVDLGNQVKLLGYDPASKAGVLRVKRGTELSLTLYWQALIGMERDYTVFLHLLDGEGRLVAQVDSQPRSGQYPTSWWMEGEVVADHYRFPVAAHLVEGEYRLVAGMYWLPTLERLPVAGGLEDMVVLARVEVE